MEYSDTSMIFSETFDLPFIAEKRRRPDRGGGGVAVLVTVSAIYALIRDTKPHGYNCPILALHIDMVYTFEPS